MNIFTSTVHNLELNPRNLEMIVSFIVSFISWKFLVIIPSNHKNLNARHRDIWSLSRFRSTERVKQPALVLCDQPLEWFCCLDADRIYLLAYLYSVLISCKQDFCNGRSGNQQEGFPCTQSRRIGWLVTMDKTCNYFLDTIGCIQCVAWSFYVQSPVIELLPQSLKW